MAASQPEPWLRGTHTDAPAVVRAVLHALELAREDVRRWSSDLTDAEIHAQPGGLPSVAFHLKHIAGSLDRLLTYAEGRELSAEQMLTLRSEQEGGEEAATLFEAFETALQDAARRVRGLIGADLESARAVGRKQLPTSVGGLLVHCADHTQRHVGQAITTAKVILATREA